MKFKTNPAIIVLPDHVDELSFVDDDIREYFKEKDDRPMSWTMGMPLQMQLIKELRLLRKALDRSE